MTKFLAPCSERKQPEILVWSRAMRRSRSLWLLSKFTVRSSTKRRTSCLVVAEGDGEVVADLLGPGPFASVGRFGVGGESNRDDVVVVGANVRPLAGGELDAAGGAGGVASSEGVDQQGGHGVSPRFLGGDLGRGG